MKMAPGSDISAAATSARRASRRSRRVAARVFDVEPQDLAVASNKIGPRHAARGKLSEVLAVGVQEHRERNARFFASLPGRRRPCRARRCRRRARPLAASGLATFAARSPSSSTESRSAVVQKTTIVSRSPSSFGRSCFLAVQVGQLRVRQRVADFHQAGRRVLLATYRPAALPHGESSGSGARMPAIVGEESSTTTWPPVRPVRRAFGRLPFHGRGPCRGCFFRDPVGRFAYGCPFWS